MSKRTYFINEFLKSLRKIYKDKNRKYDLHHPIFSNFDKKMLNYCIDSTYVSSVGNLVNKFEKKLSKFTKSKYVVCTINGTSALHIALKLIGLKNNEEVLVPSFNFIASINAILYSGGIPHFVDSDFNLGIDQIKLQKYLKKNTKIKNNRCFNLKTHRYISACIPTYSYGYGFDISNLIKICKKYKIKVIEDSSEALGTKIKNKHAGTFGTVGVLSFNGNKIITTGGGGAILTSNKHLADKARHLITTAKKNLKFSKVHDQVGYNYRMPNLNAALGLSQIQNLNEILKQKKELNKNLNNYLKKHENHIEVFKDNPNCDSNYWMQILKIKSLNPNKLLKKLNDAKINSQRVWCLVNNFKYLKKYPKMNLETAQIISKKLILLPSNKI